MCKRNFKKGKKMKKILLVFLLGISVFGSNINWENGYKEAIAKSKKLHKPLMFIVSRHTCKYCVKLKNETLSNAKVIAKLNKDFISLIQYTDDDNCMPYAIAVETRGTPAIWFLDENGLPLFQPIGGYLGADDFLNALDIVSKTYKKHKSIKGKK
jgi:thioredoxin-related protein